MNKTILTTLVMGATMFGAVKATNIADVSAEGGISFSNLSTSNGLSVREDTTNYSLLLGTAVGDGDLFVDIGLAEGDGNTDTDILVSWGRSVNLLGQDFAGLASFKKIESNIIDAYELGSNASYGAEFIISKDLGLLIDNLTLTPFASANFANDYKAVELGVSVGYDFGNGLSIGGKASYINNDADGTFYNLDHDWGFSAGISYKF